MGEGEGDFSPYRYVIARRPAHISYSVSLDLLALLAHCPSENIIIFTVGYGHCNYISQKYISTTLLRSSAKRETHTQTHRVYSVQGLTGFWNHPVAFPIYGDHVDHVYKQF